MATRTTTASTTTTTVADPLTYFFGPQVTLKRSSSMVVALDTAEDVLSQVCGEPGLVASIQGFHKDLLGLEWANRLRKHVYVGENSSTDDVSSILTRLYEYTNQPDVLRAGFRALLRTVWTSPCHGTSQRAHKRLILGHGWELIVDAVQEHALTRQSIYRLLQHVWIHGDCEWNMAVEQRLLMLLPVILDTLADSDYAAVCEASSLVHAWRVEQLSEHRFHDALVEAWTMIRERLEQGLEDDLELF